MTAIVKKVKLGWQGKQYSVAMTFGLANAIEQDINLQQFAERASIGDIRWTDAAIVFTHIFNSVGVNVQPQDVWSEMFGGEIIEKDAINVISNVISLFFPDHSKKKPSET